MAMNSRLSFLASFRFHESVYESTCTLLGDTYLGHHGTDGKCLLSSENRYLSAVDL